MKNELLIHLKFQSCSLEALNNYFKKYYIIHPTSYYKIADPNLMTLEETKAYLNDEYEIFFNYFISKHIAAKTISAMFDYLEACFKITNSSISQTVFTKEMLDKFLEIYKNTVKNTSFYVQSKVIKNIVLFYVHLNDQETIIKLLEDYLEKYDYINVQRQMIKNTGEDFFRHSLLSYLHKLKGTAKYKHIPIHSAMYGDALREKIYHLVESKNYKNIIKKFIENYVANYNADHYLLSHIYKLELSKFSCGISIPNKYNVANKLMLEAQESDNVAHIDKSMVEANMKAVNKDVGYFLLHEIYKDLSDLKRLYERGMLSKKTLINKKQHIDLACQELRDRLDKLQKDLNN